MAAVRTSVASLADTAAAAKRREQCVWRFPRLSRLLSCAKCLLLEIQMCRGRPEDRPTVVGLFGSREGQTKVWLQAGERSRDERSVRVRDTAAAGLKPRTA